MKPFILFFIFLLSLTSTAQSKFLKEKEEELARNAKIELEKKFRNISFQEKDYIIKDIAREQNIDLTDDQIYSMLRIAFEDSEDVIIPYLIKKHSTSFSQNTIAFKFIIEENFAIKAYTRVYYFNLLGDQLLLFDVKEDPNDHYGPIEYHDVINYSSDDIEEVTNKSQKLNETILNPELPFIEDIIGEKEASDRDQSKFDASGDGIFGRKIIYRDPSMLTVASSKSGAIVFKVCIDRQGVVRYMEVDQSKTTINDTKILRTAMESLRKYKYTVDFTAPAEQCGTYVIKVNNYNGFR